LAPIVSVATAGSAGYKSVGKKAPTFMKEMNC